MKQKTICIYDNEKSTVIADKIGNSRYVVQLSLEQTTTDGNEESIDAVLGYVVKVHRMDGKERLPIDRYPFEGFETDYAKAKHAFDSRVKKFAQIVEAETCDLNELDIYKERINYKLTSPKCCATCKWHRRAIDMHSNNCQNSNSMTYECHNPQNQQVFMYSWHSPEINRVHKPDCKCDDRYNWKKLPWQYDTYDRFDKRGELPLNKTFVKVDALGICNSYTKMENNTDI